MKGIFVNMDGDEVAPTGDNIADHAGMYQDKNRNVWMVEPTGADPLNPHWTAKAGTTAQNAYGLTGAHETAASTTLPGVIEAIDDWIDNLESTLAAQKQKQADAKSSSLGVFVLIVIAAIVFSDKRKR